LEIFYIYVIYALYFIDLKDIAKFQKSPYRWQNEPWFLNIGKYILIPSPSPEEKGATAPSPPLLLCPKQIVKK
jgi:hypothetical protein